MFLITLFLPVIALSNLDDKAFGAAIAVDGNSKTSLGSTVLGRSLAITQTGDHPEDSKDIPITTAAVLTEPASRAYNAFYQIADISLHEPVSGVGTFHGFVSNPTSRAKLCQLRVNKNCGPIMYEPQSVEGLQGFPHAANSPPDGKIASGNNPIFNQLNEYGSDRWTSVEFPEVNCHNETHVQFDLTWYFTATHSSDNIEIYISNEKYTSTEPLSRRHLDLNPLCSMDFYGHHPPSQLTISCPISLKKYHQLNKLKELLLLSVWNIDDTAYAFYQVVDLQGLSPKQSLENIKKKCSIVTV